jgi:serine/threonine-protein kinase PpkA
MSNSTPPGDAEQTVAMSANGSTAFAGAQLPPEYDALQVPGYRVQRLLGRGGMGAVFLAEDVESGEHVAVKMLLPAAREDLSLVRRLEREGLALRDLDHPNIVGFRAFIDDPAGVFLVIDYVPGGGTLEQVIRNGLLDEQRVLHVAAEACAGLACASAAGIVHRDVKPGNLLVAHAGEDGTTTLTTDSRIMLADFGLALGGDAMDALTRLTMPGTAVGTPVYMAPEQASGAEVDCRADIYALGVVLAHAVTGMLPFAGEDLMALLTTKATNPVPDPRTTGVVCSDEFAALLARMTAPDPARRYPDYETLAGVIARLQQAATPAPGLTGRLGEAWRRLTGGQP